jgi:hypothetical protein
MAAAGMAVVNCVALTNVVAGAVPPKLTIEAATKFVPLIVSVKPSTLPAMALFGETVVIVGTGFGPLVMVKFTAFEVPPPGAGLVTVTAAVAAEAMAAAGMVAVNCVELTNVVLHAVAPKLTIEAATKFVPLTVSVKATPSAMALFCEIVVIVGVGLDPLGGGG